MTLTPPWDTDAAAQNAAYVLAHRGLGEREYTEARDAAVFCPACSAAGRPAARLLRVFVGPHADGTTRTWLLVPSFKLARVPSLCAPVPLPGEPYRPLHGRCGRCHTGVLAVYSDGQGTFERLRADRSKHYMVIRPGAPERDALAAGDGVVTCRLTGEWLDGPVGSWLALTDSPTRGTVAQD